VTRRKVKDEEFLIAGKGTVIGIHLKNSTIGIDDIKEVRILNSEPGSEERNNVLLAQKAGYKAFELSFELLTVDDLVKFANETLRVQSMFPTI